LEVQLVFLNMKDERCRRRILYRQVRELVYKVSTYLKHEANASMPAHDVVRSEERAAELCDFALEICKELLVMVTLQFVSLPLCHVEGFPPSVVPTTTVL
jgi:hypothetical protein